jgi:ATP-dependent RNA helicase DeaD
LPEPAAFVPSAVPTSRASPAGAIPAPRAVPPAPTFEKPERKLREKPIAKRDLANAPLVRYRIEVGKNQGALPKEIVGAIANEGGIDGKLIGQINLFDDYSTVELPELPADILDVLKRTRVRQVPLKIRVAAVGEGDKPRFDKGRRPTGADFSRKPAPRSAAERRPQVDDAGRTRRAAGTDFGDRPRKPAGKSTGKPAGKFAGKREKR